jgi:hypothetical protein
VAKIEEPKKKRFENIEKIPAAEVHTDRLPAKKTKA